MILVALLLLLLLLSLLLLLLLLVLVLLLLLLTGSGMRPCLLLDILRVAKSALARLTICVRGANSFR